MKRLLLSILFLLAFVNVGSAQYTNPNEGKSIKEEEYTNSTPSTPSTNRYYAFTAGSGSGLNDMTSGGTYSGTAATYFTVVIDGVSSPNTFKWKQDAGGYTTGVVITGGAQTLASSVTVTFTATTGHTLNDTTVVTIVPTIQSWWNASGDRQFKNIAGTTKTFATLTDFASPPSTGYGNTTPRPIAATTISSTGQYTNTLADGTAPMVITSTTVVANLNADKLDGGDWAAPPAGGFGSTTPRPVAATTITCSTTAAITGALTVSGQLTTNDVHVLKRKAVTLGVGAATINVANANIVDVTGDGGANAVTSLTGGIDGQVVRLHFKDTNVTMTDGGTLKLAGNLVSTADDSMTLSFDGTNWTEDSRSVN